ncbi:type II and III secretion system protein family protein [Duganella violaceipulchra]|uniref:Pilus assembly protein CpaC n=1 Tax=Duganella violaceipulchra TaxID=2849652 RepID=A0AA41H5E7_9BURK|nr:type II and III secretion system protein family protein [Duganella violaceicalia]MBV6320474.1 type II and III secretion system protein family protein [Duganella violaceicalia]MCP2008818.1 pilus assembly protein CpaC [Duganella violaceicalia]
MTTLRYATLLLAMAGLEPTAAAANAAATLPATVPGAGRSAPDASQGRDAVSLRCSGQAATPGNLTLALGKSTLMRMPEAVLARSVGNPAVLQAILVAPDTLYVVGVDIGSSNMIVQGRSGMCNVIEVVVGIDPTALQNALAALMPEQKDIHVSAAGDTLVISGTVDDAPTAARVLELASAFVRRPAQALEAAKGDKGGAAGGAAPAAPAAPQAAAAAAGATRIVNFLNVGAPQQVMLEVKIAEVSKTLLDKLETGLSLSFGGGSWSTTLASNFISGTLKGLLSGGKATGNHVGIAADKQDGLVRILAEPTVMAISGQEGSFLAGGKIFVPVAQDNNKITLEEKEFGIGLHFTPTVLAGGRINLRVAPEVSELSREGIGISAAGFSGGAILPLITTRRAATTVELFDGQSFAIGGLISNNQTTNIRGLPVLGELPVLGALFRSTDFQQDRTELLFVVTPHLVKPLPPNYKLPTDSVTTPSRAQLFLEGRMEGPQAQSTDHK